MWYKEGFFRADARVFFLSIANGRLFQLKTGVFPSRVAQLWWLPMTSLPFHHCPHHEFLKIPNLLRYATSQTVQWTPVDVSEERGRGAMQ